MASGEGRARVTTGTIVGEYRVEEPLGQGGMGYVMAARHRTRGDRVALKFLWPEELAPDAVARMEREAAALAALQSPHAIRVHGFHLLADGTPYIAMELACGKNLGAILQERSCLPIHEAAGYLAQACDALAEAHAIGIVHRDLKPTNLFVTRTSSGTEILKLMDFGIAKVVGAHGLTSTANALGTPHYMSPEQIHSSRKVDPRTDVFALGVCFFKLVSGKFPFDGETAPAVFVAIASATATKLSAVREGAPAEVEAFIERCLAKDPQERIQTIAECRDALARFARTRYTQIMTVPAAMDAAAPRSVPGERTSVERDLTTRPWTSTAPRAVDGRARAALAISVVFALAGILATGGVLMSRRPPKGDVAAASVVPPPASARSSENAPSDEATAIRAASSASSASSASGAELESLGDGEPSVTAPATSTQPRRRRPRGPSPAASVQAAPDPYGGRR